MTFNANLAQNRDQLLEDMLQLSNDSNLHTVLEQTLKQILQLKPLSPYLYLHKKMSLRSKFDNSKNSQYVCELAMYLSNTSPLTSTKQTITNKLMSICIDKFNHMKIKKFETNQFMNFILIDLGEKQKTEFIKNINDEKMDNDNIPVNMFANIMYWTLVYLWTVREINEISSKLKNLGIGNPTSYGSGENSVSCELLNEYLDKVDEEDSALRMIGISQVNEGENILDKVSSIIFKLLEQNQPKNSTKI